MITICKIGIAYHGVAPGLNVASQRKVAVREAVGGKKRGSLFSETPVEDMFFAFECRKAAKRMMAIALSHQCL